ncbi:LytTR family transcriptional regulator [Fulvivirga sp. 29W222]|uniref:LytTR family transcriptional regulator n=1 Tax=Fulvivirga marina TaxID=2494733 RepID=A0A937FZ78_9BACT|nr:LytTR family DNA-binding domain-containing protein [Fulvivirga marina]MBL6448840.1 LytTR family transcriptional regulator [Fulvivirga marina]
MILSLNRIRDIQILINPHPYVKGWRTKLKVALFFFITISFVLLFLEPFKTGESPKVLVLGYSSGVFLAYMTVLLSESVLFQSRQQWTLRDETLMYILFFVLSAIFVYWYDLVVIKSTAYYWSDILSFTGRVTLPFTIIFLPGVGWLRYYYGKVYERSDLFHVTIRGNVKADVLEMDQRKILYVRSSDNYVVIKYIDSDFDLKETLLRSTLAQIEGQLPALLKCHRSYLINPLHLVDVEGSQKKASIKLSGLEEEIPLSKTYYNNIKDLLFKG